MEPVGLGIGIAGLAGALTACIDCFEYIQLGRQFGQDYGKFLLKLDVAKLRISRWGVAMGLGSEPQLRPQISASDENIRLAQSLLEQIQESFEDAERISERFMKHNSIQDANSNEMLVCNADFDMDSDYQRLHLTMRQLAFKRQKETSIRKKAAWALYEKRRVERMIDDVNGFINNLVDLFPTAQDDQRACCRIEVFTINKSQDLSLLNDIACKDDQMLSAEITRELDNRGHNVTDWKANGSSKMWAGDENAFGVDSKGHNFARFTLSGHADVHLGNINRGK
ncbi:MAG: hypothetical protein Q9214_006313 [Letrouitia sp. 1 TL-2023]